jgi:hypothetical protein
MIVVAVSCVKKVAMVLDADCLRQLAVVVVVKTAPTKDEANG